MEPELAVLTGSAVALSAAALFVSVRRLYLATLAARILRKELSEHYQQLLGEWTERLTDTDDTATFRLIQKQLELVVVKSIRDRALQEQVFENLHQPSQEGREKYVRKIVSESEHGVQSMAATGG